MSHFSAFSITWLALLFALCEIRRDVSRPELHHGHKNVMNFWGATTH